jgi:cellulose biosynthesis protein BcsQ
MNGEQSVGRGRFDVERMVAVVIGVCHPVACATLLCVPFSIAAQSPEFKAIACTVEAPEDSRGEVLTFYFTESGLVRHRNAQHAATVTTRFCSNIFIQESGEDVRYLLAKLLICSKIRNDYDVVLFDSPPRLTSAAINGLCASTHILVPTVLDRLSAEAVGTFLGSARKLKIMLNPSLELLGVVGMITDQDRLRRCERNARSVVLQQINESWGGKPKVFDRHIPRRAAIQHAAGDAVAYLQDDDVKSLFDKLGQEIGEELEWTAKREAINEGRSASRSFA